MSLAILGRATFEDLYEPAKGKSEWGMDTLTRKMSGARSLLDAFIATLAQGQIFEGYYLQTWEPDDNPDIATVTLNYKGLLTNGTPVPDAQTEIVLSKGVRSADYSSENDGKGRLYATGVLGQFGTATPGPGEYGTMVQWTFQKFCTSAVMEFTYRTAQTRYRYISIGRSSAPRYSTVNFPFDPQIINRRIVTSDGSTFGADFEVRFGLTPVENEQVVSYSSRQVIGTPFFECEDTVRIELGNPLTP
jgi:hypothetical protein